MTLAANVDAAEPETVLVPMRDGTEELYDCETDCTWNHHNLLAGPRKEAHRSIAEELRK